MHLNGNLSRVIEMGHFANQFAFAIGVVDEQHPGHQAIILAVW